jgi:hypothetical protein
MIRVKQTKFGPVEGNCFAACIASLLEVPIEEVPIDPSADSWWSTTQCYLRSKNMFFLEVRLDVAMAYPLYAMNNVYCIFTGRSPRKFAGHDVVNHCVVGMIDSLPDQQVIFTQIHDPHPDNTFLVDGSIWGLGFILKFDPSKP